MRTKGEISWRSFAKASFSISRSGSEKTRATSWRHYALGNGDAVSKGDRIAATGLASDLNSNLYFALSKRFYGAARLGVP